MSCDTRNSENAAETKASNGKASSRGPRPTEALPTNRIAVSKQYDLLRAFGAVSGPDGNPVTNVEVAKIANLHASTVGLAVPFFTASGLLTKTNDGLVPPPEVLDFNAAYEWNPETAFHRTAPVLSNTWFFERLLPKLRFGPLSRKDAIQELAMASSAAPDYRGQLDTLIEYLEASGLVRRDGDSIRLASSSEAEPDEGAATGKATELISKAETVQQKVVPPVSTSFTGPTAGVVQFNISVKVDMTEFAGWSPDRISAFFSGVAQVLAAKGSVEEQITSMADI